MQNVKKGSLCVSFQYSFKLFFVNEILCFGASYYAFFPLFPDRGNKNIFFLSPRRPVRVTAHPASYQLCTGGSSLLVIKRPGCEADHSPPSSADIKTSSRRSA